MRVYDDLRAKAGVMRLTENERRCGLCEQSVIKRKLILIDIEVCDRFLTEALIEYKSIGRALIGIASSPSDFLQRPVSSSGLIGFVLWLNHRRNQAS